MRKLLTVVAALSLLATPFACDFQLAKNQLQADKVMVATLLATPSVDVDAIAFLGIDAAGFDAGGFDGGAFDGGGFDAGSFDAGSFAIDAGGLSLDGGVITFPAQTAAFGFFGSRKLQSLDPAPSPISSAELSVGAVGSAAVKLKGDGKGNYNLTSADEPGFTYEEGKTYQFTAEYEGASYVGEVAESPARERIEAFHPPQGFLELTAGASYTFTRPEPPAGKERNIGFITVIPISPDGEKGDPTYNNMPKGALELLELVASPKQWKQASYTIPGTAFPDSKKTYLILFQSVKSGGPKSDNLFAGSALMVGTADVGVVRTK